MKVKSIFSTVMSLILAASAVSVIPVFAASETATIKLGDVSDGDGVTNLDAYWIKMYLNGSVTATRRQLTAMDVNQDGIIDDTDANLISQSIVSGQILPNVTKELYNVPDNSTVTYYKHNCSSTNANQSSTYTIQSTQEIPFSSGFNNSYAQSSLNTDILDRENINCVKITSSSVQGSGFVIDDHVIATAAHCLYNANGFVSNTNVEIYDENCKNIIESVNAKYIHIPKNYAISGDVNYDYGLIYVEEDLSEYKVNVGVMTDYFMTTGQLLITSGFTSYNNTTKRYYSSGAVDTMDFLPLEKPYRFHSYGKCKSGKSGGMVYFESSFLNSQLKSVVGNATHTSGEDTYGCRMTTTLLRFFYQNSNLC